MGDKMGSKPSVKGFTIKPSHAEVRCLCDRVSDVKIDSRRRIHCSCGAMLRVESKPNGYVQPFATVNDFRAMKRAGVAKHIRPKIVGWIWSG